MVGAVVVAVVASPPRRREKRRWAAALPRDHIRRLREDLSLFLSFSLAVVARCVRLCLWCSCSWCVEVLIRWWVGCYRESGVGCGEEEDSRTFFVIARRVRPTTSTPAGRGARH